MGDRAASDLPFKRVRRSPGELLTQRQKQFLRCLARGLSGPEIQRYMGISHGREWRARSELYRVLGVRKVSTWKVREAIAKAIELRVLRPAEVIDGIDQPGP